MLDHDQLTPEETRERNQLLIQDLSRYYDTRAEDSASLARIRARLLQRAAGPLPLVDDGELTRPPLFMPARHVGSTGIRFVHTFAKGRLRHPYLNALVAAMLLLALVGSFVLMFHTWQATGSSAVAHDWTLLAKFSGAGNRTITGLDFEVGHKYGWSITCTNSDSQDNKVSFEFNDGDEGSGYVTCAAVTTKPLEPALTAVSPGGAFPLIHTIKVMADASISWELLLFRGIYYPPLTYTPDWHPFSGEMDGTGGTWVGISPTVTLPKTWALEFACHGTGSFKIDLESGNQPNVSEIAGSTAPCNGQTNFDVFYLVGQGMTVSQMQITTAASNDWQSLLLGCTNNKPDCGITSQAPMPTP